MSGRHPLLSRRQILLGGSAAVGAVLLGGCGSGSDSSDEQGGSSTSGTDGASGKYALAQFFGGPMFVAGQTARLPFGVADADGLLRVDDTPEELEVQVLTSKGEELGAPISVTRHADGLPRAYFPLITEIADPGIYTARTEIDGVGTEMAFQINAADEVTAIRPGMPLPAVDTPTVNDPHGVTPICTADPLCPLHEVTLAEALGEGRPIGLLVSTPAFCQIAICGPVLDVLLGLTASHPDVRFLHAEVYADPKANLDTYAPVIEALGLHFEPCLILAGADGVVVERLDTIFDRAEADARLARLA